MLFGEGVFTPTTLWSWKTFGNPIAIAFVICGVLYLINAIWSEED